MLDREFHYYKAHENELVKQYNGKFIAIVGEQVVGVFDEEFTAYQEMKTKYGLGNFLTSTLRAHCRPTGPALPFTGSVSLIV